MGFLRLLACPNLRFIENMLDRYRMFHNLLGTRHRWIRKGQWIWNWRFPFENFNGHQGNQFWFALAAPVKHALIYYTYIILLSFQVKNRLIPAISQAVTIIIIITQYLSFYDTGLNFITRIHTVDRILPDNECKLCGQSKFDSNQSTQSVDENIILVLCIHRHHGKKRGAGRWNFIAPPPPW